MAYATIADVESLWRKLTPDEEPIVSALLDAAAVYLDKFANTTDLDALELVSVNMVRRAYKRNGDTFTQDGMYNAINGWAALNEPDDMWLSGMDKKLVGYGTRVKFVEA